MNSIVTIQVRSYQQLNQKSMTTRNKLLYKTHKHQSCNMNTKYHHKCYRAVEIDPIQKVNILFDLDPINSSKNSIKSQQQQVVIKSPESHQ